MARGPWGQGGKGAALPCSRLPLGTQLARLDICRGAGLEENCSSGKACCMMRLKNPKMCFICLKRLAEGTQLQTVATWVGRRFLKRGVLFWEMEM